MACKGCNKTKEKELEKVRKGVEARRAEHEARKEQVRKEVMERKERQRRERGLST